MGADLDVEPTAPLGDCGDLLRYRLRGGQLSPVDLKQPYGVLGHSYLAITCDVRGLDPLLRARLDAIEAHVWSGEQTATITEAWTPRFTNQRNTVTNVWFLAVLALFTAIWLSAAISYLLTL